MAFYRICPDCGEQNRFEQRGLPPRACASCHRSLSGVPLIHEDDLPAPPSDERDHAAQEPPIQDAPCPKEDEEPLFYLEDAAGGFRIPIPLCGGSVGRGELGGEALLPYPAVSRAHITVRYRGRLGLTIEDTSRYGTSINGERMRGGMTRFVREGDEIKLYDLALIVRKTESAGGDT